MKIEVSAPSAISLRLNGGAVTIREQAARASRGIDLKHNILPFLLRFNPAFNRMTMLLN